MGHQASNMPIMAAHVSKISLGLVLEVGVGLRDGEGINVCSDGYAVHLAFDLFPLAPDIHH